MKSSPLIAIILITATIGLPISARADSASSESVQTVVITGSNNSVNQQNNTYTRGSARGGTSSNSNSTRNRQSADIAGDNNTVNQSNRTQVVDRHATTQSTR
jgi:hypothetical protein